MPAQLKGLPKRFFPTIRRIKPLIEDPVYAWQRRALTWLIIFIFETSAFLILAQKNLELGLALTAAVATRQKTQKSLTDLEKNLELIRKSPQAVEKLLEIIPSFDSSHNVLTTLNQLTSLHGLTISQINFLPPDPRQGVATEQKINFQLTGDFESVVAFAEELKKNQQLILIDSLELNLAQANKPSEGVRADFLVKTFFIPREKKLLP